MSRSCSAASASISSSHEELIRALFTPKKRRTAGVSGSAMAARATESIGASPEPPATQTISRSGGVRR